jgi:hypothetical protein
LLIRLTVQNVEHVLGKYIISDKPMTEQEWAAAQLFLPTAHVFVEEKCPLPKSRAILVALWSAPKAPGH